MRSHPLNRGDDHRAPLLDDAELDRLRLLALQYRGRRRALTASFGSGDHPAAARGQGLELHDVRAYHAGDDIRHMDWRATARSGRPMTKVFRQERAHSIFLVVDRRPSMMFGTRKELKAATAARVAAMLAFIAVADRDAVAGVVIDRELHRFPAARRLEDVLPLLRSAAAPAPLPASAPMPATPDLPRSLANAAHPAGATYIISDFNDMLCGETTIEDGFGALGPDPKNGRGTAPRALTPVVAVRIIDPAEQALSMAGVLQLTSPRGGLIVDIDTTDTRLRARFQALAAERSAELEHQCHRQGIRLVTIRNDVDLIAQLEPLL